MSFFNRSTGERLDPEEIRNARWEKFTATYFISDGRGHVKIGKSSHVKKRLQDIQVANPYECQLLGVTEKDECEIHVKFAEYHIRGEWFTFSEEIQEWVDENCLKVDL